MVRRRRGFSYGGKEEEGVSVLSLFVRLPSCFPLPALGLVESAACSLPVFPVFPGSLAS